MNISTERFAGRTRKSGIRSATNSTRKCARYRALITVIGWQEKLRDCFFSFCHLASSSTHYMRYTIFSKYSYHVCTRNCGPCIETPDFDIFKNFIIQISSSKSAFIDNII